MANTAKKFQVSGHHNVKITYNSIHTMQMSTVKSHRTVTNFSFFPDLLLIFLKCKCLFHHPSFTTTILVQMFYVVYKQNKSSNVKECWSTYTTKLLENLPHNYKHYIMCKSNSSVTGQI